MTKSNVPISFWAILKTCKILPEKNQLILVPWIFVLKLKNFDILKVQEGLLLFVLMTLSSWEDFKFSF